MINIYVNADTLGDLVDSSGGKNINNPLTFQYQSCQTIGVNINTISGTTLTPVDCSSATTWTATLNNNFSHSNLMVSVTNSDIVSTSSATGLIKVKVNCNTTNFLNAVNGKESITAFFQVRGWFSGVPIYSYIMNCVCYNSLDTIAST